MNKTIYPFYFVKNETHNYWCHSVIFQNDIKSPHPLMYIIHKGAEEVPRRKWCFRLRHWGLQRHQTYTKYTITVLVVDSIWVHIIPLCRYTLTEKAITLDGYQRHDTNGIQLKRGQHTIQTILTVNPFVSHSMVHGRHFAVLGLTNTHSPQHFENALKKDMQMHEKVHKL